MKLSMIIISYNEAEYLPEALDSCLNQNVDFDFEIIVGDDGSTDDSINIIREYENRYPGIIKHFVMDRDVDEEIIPSIRVSNILKKGFKIASGQYLCELSGDDILIDKEKLKKQVDFLDLNPQYYSCYTNYQLFWNNGKTIDCKMRASLGNKCLWACQYIDSSAFVFRRECVKNLLDRFCDDTGLFFSLLKTGKTKHIDIMGLGYRQRETSIMHEADEFELCILELLLMQDAFNSGKYLKETMARSNKPLQNLIKNRKKLSDEKYSKYIKNGNEHSNDIIKQIVNYNDNKKQLNSIITKAKIWSIIYKIIRKIEIATKVAFHRQ